MVAPKEIAVSIIIPNWNGESFLGRCLAATVQSAQNSGFSWELIVVDDCSTDSAPQTLPAQFPQARWVFNQKNLGFGETVNHGVRESCGRYLVLLNNDLVPREHLIRELVSPLVEHTDVFGVSGRTIDWGAQEPNHLNMMGQMCEGRLQLMYEDSPQCCDTMFVQGGCCAYRRDVFEELGGFWSGFAPGYWEDYDLSYCALKTGWRNLYNPAADAFHFGQGSMNRAHGADRILAIRERNALLFLWLNLTDSDRLSAHLYGLPRLLAQAVSHYNKREQRCFVKGLWAAWKCRGMVVAERHRRARLAKLTDAAVFDAFADRGKTC